LENFDIARWTKLRNELSQLLNVRKRKRKKEGCLKQGRTHAFQTYAHGEVFRMMHYLTADQNSINCLDNSAGAGRHSFPHKPSLQKERGRVQIKYLLPAVYMHQTSTFSACR